MHILPLPLGPIQTNCYLIGDEATRAAVVVDPGDEAPLVLSALKQKSWQLQAVWLTHAHFDHIGGVAGLVEATGVPVALHPLELPLLRAKGGATLFGVNIPPCPEPNVLLEPGQFLECGALKFEVLFVPGHTVGHVAFATPGAVFSGDVLFKDGIGRTDLPGGHYATLIHSIKEVLFKLPDDTQVYSGHGPVTTIGDERKLNPFLAD